VRNFLAEIGKRTYTKLSDPYYAGGAAEVSFWFLLSLVPASVLLAQLLKVFTLSYAAIKDVLSTYISEETMDMVLPLLEYRPNRAVTILLIVLALWAGSLAIFSLMRISNYAYHGGLPYKSAVFGWIRERLRAIFLTVLVLVTLIFALYILVYGELITKTSLSYANRYLGGGYTFSEVWLFWRWPLAYLLFFLMLFILYYFLPLAGSGYSRLLTGSKLESVKRVTLEWFKNRVRALRPSVPGAAMAAGVMLAATWIYAFFVRTIAQPNYNLIYGGFSSVAVLLIWLYFMIYILIIGVQVNAACAELLGVVKSNDTEVRDMNEFIKELDAWLAQEGLDPGVREELTELKARYEKDPQDEAVQGEISDRFYRFMEFGTAGMRGVMGAGPNRINIHTVRKISQGYADHLNEEYGSGGRVPKVAIAYDNRRNSDVFAREAGLVFAANGIETHLFGTLSATPLLSYAARVLGTDGGVVLTASHNNKAYNGYKIYDSHGCQCMPEEAAKVAAKIDRVDMWTGVKTVTESPLLHIIGPQMQEAYIERVLAESRTPGALSDLSVVYTPLNGTGNVPVRALLAKAGIGKLTVVPEQENPDPDFTTCPEPNPEKRAALEVGLALCGKLRDAGEAPDLLIGTDPDADRLGVAILHDGEYRQLSGNQVGFLILDYIIASREREGAMPDRPVFITTIVSTPLTGEMAKKHGIETRKVLTGFKNIGDQMNDLEADGEVDRYIFGFEESCGYLSGTYARDKDAQNAALLLLEAAGVLKARGKTLLDRIEEIYGEYGYFIDGLDELVRPGEKGMHEIQAIMAKLREPEALTAFSAVVNETADYQARERTVYKLGGRKETAPISGVPPSDVVEFALADGCQILARPSGTEPKCKIYYTGVGATEEAARKAIDRMKGEVAKLLEV
jgi:phosphoglucomutase